MSRRFTDGYCETMSGDWLGAHHRHHLTSKESMSLNRWAVRRDANEVDIVKALKAFGFKVERLSRVDLMVLAYGEVHLLEVKTMSGTHTSHQLRMISEGWPIKTVTTISEAIKAVTTERKDNTSHEMDTHRDNICISSVD